MPSDDYEEWEGSDDFNELVDMLQTYNVGAGQDFIDRDDLSDYLLDVGAPEDWDNVDLVFNGDGECYLVIQDGNETEEFYIGGQEEFEQIYGYFDDMDVDFDVKYEGD